MAETQASTGGYAAGSSPGYSPVAGAAMGYIAIDTSQAEQAPAKMASVAAGINQAMSQVSAGTNNAQIGISQVTSAVKQLAGAFGVSFSIAGVVQLGKMAIDAAEVATAYNRQSVAARGLAGSQKEVNALMAEYQEDTQGAVDQATELSDTTKLLSLGFADNTKKLGDFVTAARGITMAGFGTSQSDTEGRLMQAVISQRKQSFRELGLEYDQIKQRSQELQAADSSLSSTMAFTQAAIEQANAKFGDLAKTPPTGIEKTDSAAKNLAKTFGELVGPAVSLVGDDFSRTLDHWASQLQVIIQLATAAGNAARGIGQAVGLVGPNPTPKTPSWLTSATGSAMPANADEINATKLDWGKGIADLTQKTNEDLLQQNQDYQRQRSGSERQYQQSTLRAAEDFAQSRQREEQDMADSISRIHRDSAQREAHEAADLARSISQAETDGAERVAKDKKDATERLAELDTNYEKERVKRAKDLSDKLLDAAGNLDAKQVYELQRDAAKQEEEAKTAHDDQRDKLQKQLSERLDDESKSLAKSIAQQQDAYNRQLQDGRDADAQRITDMQADFDKRKTQEDVDYGIRLTRAQQDHNDQLTEMDRAQGLRITQIQTHAAQERTQLDTGHEAALVKLGVHNQDWIDAETKLNTAALKLLEPLLTAGRSLLLFPNAGSNTLPFPSMVGANAPAPYTGGGGNYSNSHSFSPTVNVTISGSSSLTKSDVESAVHDALIKTFEDLN